jgi:hypothetical protein
MTRVREVSRDELQARRQEVLERVGMSYEELAHRADQRSLVGEEWAAWDEIRSIEFLMGDDEAAR